MRRIVFVLPVFVLAIASYGCSSSSSSSSGSEGTANISGTVQSKSLGSFKTALADVDSSSTQGALVITISDIDTCEDVSAGPRKSSNALTLTLTVRTDDDGGSGTTTYAAPTQPGTFAADDSSNNGAYVEYTPLDGACMVTQDGVEKWRAGTVTITSLNGGVVSGSFDLTGGDISNGADHLTGTFTTVSCPGSADLYMGVTSAGSCH